MYKRELDTLISSSSLPKSLLLYGEEFYTSYYVGKISALITDKESVLSFYFDEYEKNSAKNFISQPSLFGDTNLLYIKSDKKIPKKELDEFVEICKKNPNSFFIFEFTGEDRVAKDLTKSFTKKKGGDFVRFFKPNFSESMALLQQSAKELNLNIQTQAIRELLLLENDDLSLCTNELKKLQLLDKEITPKDVRDHVYGMGEIVLDDFIVKLLQKADIKDELEMMLDSSSHDEVKIVNAIANYISMLLEFHLYIKAFGSYDTKEILGYVLPQNIAKQRASLSIMITPLQYEQLLKELLNSEYMLKNEKNIEKNSFLYATLIKLQSFL